MSAKTPAVSALTRTLSAYIAQARTRRLPPQVIEKTKHHVLDALAACISGSRLKPGRVAHSYVRSVGGAEEAGVAGSDIVTSASHAALANGMSAHADETDDSHQASNTHPGCAIVPAALAMAERERADGLTLSKAVAAGYDINCRLTLAFGPQQFKRAGHSNHSFGGVFGAAVAAGVVAGFDSTQIRHLLSYTTQQASGIRTFERDTAHTLKAFVFGGMTARNGVAAATMVQHGFSGIDDELSGPDNRNLFDVYAPGARPHRLLRDLGRVFEIMNTNIKKWTVGSPNQAALDALLFLLSEHDLEADDVTAVIVETPANEVRIVDNSNMPDICMQHVLALMLVDGTVTFESCHDVRRMTERRIVEARKRIRLVPSESLARARPRRQAIVTLLTRDGRRFAHRTHAVRGTADNPMTREEVAAKCFDLTAPVIGPRRARKLIDAVWGLDELKDVRTLRRYYQPG